MCSLYFIKGDIEELFKEKKTECYIQSCYCHARLSEGIFQVSTKLPESKPL